MELTDKHKRGGSDQPIKEGKDQTCQSEEGMITLNREGQHITEQSEEGRIRPAN